MEKSCYVIGHRAEITAMLWLMCKGYVPVCRHFRPPKNCGAGEVDLIMRRGKTLVFVEVKHRKYPEDAIEPVAIEQYKRIVHASGIFLKRYPMYRTCTIRYDSVLLRPHHWPRHTINAYRVL